MEDKTDHGGGQGLSLCCESLVSNELCFRLTCDLCPQRQVHHPFVHELQDCWQTQRHLYISESIDETTLIHGPKPSLTLPCLTSTPVQHCPEASHSPWHDLVNVCNCVHDIIISKPAESHDPKPALPRCLTLATTVSKEYPQSLMQWQSPWCVDLIFGCVLNQPRPTISTLFSFHLSPQCQ